ncbi:MAG: adenylate/guanylate cyclase domain-containing protein [Candidatus Gastranaerophilales bacterium]|nr:adenylate/guanylate cyclase domain-containing protein [Candidatus Gastranaerophilales bacterium]
MRFLKFLLLLLSIGLFLWLAYWATDEFFEPKAYNYMVKTFTANKAGSDNIVLIVIDDKSIGRHRWPWKRNLYCGIYNYFREYTKAKVVISDSIVTSNDDIQADREYFNCLKQMNNLVVGTTFSARPYYDKKFGEEYDKKFHNKLAIDINDLRIHANDFPFKSAVIFPEAYLDSIKMAGSITTARGADGYLRVAINAINYKGTIYPSLALRAFSYINDNEGFCITDREIIGDKSKVHIPTNRENEGIFSHLRFYQPNPSSSSYSHKTYSAIDIMDSYKELKLGQKPLVDPSEFDNKIVLIGANVKAAATGLADVKRTPISNEHSGLDIQATTLDNILNKYFMYELQDWQNVFFALSLMLLTFIIIRKHTLFIALTEVSIIIIAYITLCALLYRHGYAINTITPISMTIITMIFAYSHKYILEDRNKEKIKSAMGKYISEDIMKSVVKNIDELKLGGKKANVTVLFADIRGFTSMSEKLSADEVSVILNEYFTEIEPIVTRNNGVINKFIGDAVMAIFGEPIQDENHPKNAVKCACEMLDKVKELQTKWLEEGKPKIEIGIGINTGEAFVGNIGSEKRMEYTVIGDMVNLASRIEGNNKIYKTNLLISSSTYAHVRGIVDIVKISNVKIRGKEHTLDLYEVIRLIG